MHTHTYTHIHTAVAVIEGLFSRVRANEVLQKVSLDELEHLWIEVTSQSPIRAGFIQQLDDALQAVERERTQSVGEYSTKALL